MSTLNIWQGLPERIEGMDRRKYSVGFIPFIDFKAAKLRKEAKKIV